MPALVAIRHEPFVTGFYQRLLRRGLLDFVLRIVRRGDGFLQHVNGGGLRVLVMVTSIGLAAAMIAGSVPAGATTALQFRTSTPLTPASSKAWEFGRNSVTGPRSGSPPAGAPLTR